MDRKLAATGFATGMMDELKRVTWPSKKETIRLTLVVLVISLIIGLYIGIIDVGLTKVLEYFTKK